MSEVPSRVHAWTKRTKRTKRTTPIPISVKGVAFSDILLYGLTRGDAGSLAVLDCQHYHGLLEGPP